MLLQEKLQNKNIILASQSPRRKELLSGLDIDFTIQPLHADESYSTHLKGKEITEYLCQKKANAYEKWQDNDLLITSDTIVWLDNRALEKPKDKTEAKAMLKELSGKTHEVITSLGVFSTHKSEIITDITQVTFAELTEEEISYYVYKYKPYDKAGSYGVQEWIGYMGVKNMNGSYFTVMGLPVFKLYQVLKAW